jgi:hypothetical protein
MAGCRCGKRKGGWLNCRDYAHREVLRELASFLSLFGQNELAGGGDLQAIILLLMADNEKPGAAHQFSARDHSRRFLGWRQRAWLIVPIRFL